MKENFTAKETARLYEWLMDNGHTREDANNCITYIVTGVKKGEQPKNRHQADPAREKPE